VNFDQKPKIKIFKICPSLIRFLMLIISTSGPFSAFICYWSHVSRTVSGCFAALRQLRSIRRSVSASVFHSLFVSLAMPRLDYCNATLAGLPASQLNRLQSVLNAAAKLIHRSSRYEHVTPMLLSFDFLLCLFYF